MNSKKKRKRAPNWKKEQKTPRTSKKANNNKWNNNKHQIQKQATNDNRTEYTLTEKQRWQQSLEEAKTQHLGLGRWHRTIYIHQCRENGAIGPHGSSQLEKKPQEHHKGRGKEAQEAWTHLGNSKELQMHQARQESPERRLQFKKPERNRQNRTIKGESTSGKRRQRKSKAGARGQGRQSQVRQPRMKSKGETPSKAKNHPLKRQGMLSSGRKKLMQRKEQLRQRTNKTDTKTGKSKAKGAPLKSNGGSKTNKENKANKTRSPYCSPFLCFTRVYHGKAKKPNTGQREKHSPMLSTGEKE